MLITKSELCSLIPHSGGMCLLDGVLEWDESSIVCISMSHRDPANPLRRAGRLMALHGIEYGAQAVAVHGGLLARSAGRQAPPAFLVAVRDARLHTDYLDGGGAKLDISARRLLTDARNVIYAIRVGAAGVLLVEARVTIMASPTVE